MSFNPSYPFENLFKDKILDMISKEKYQTNKKVKDIIFKLIDQEKGFIFKDISDERLKRIILKNHKISFIS